jgi:hypothetical protein
LLARTVSLARSFFPSLPLSRESDVFILVDAEESQFARVAAGGSAMLLATLQVALLVTRDAIGGTLEVKLLVAQRSYLPHCCYEPSLARAMNVIYTCIRIYVYTYACIHTDIHLYIFMYVYTYMHTYMHTYVCMYYIHTYVYVCTYVSLALL